MGAEVEELLERQKVLVSLLAPLPKADEHKVLLQVTLFFGPGVQAGVLDRHRRLDRERLRPLHLVGPERPVAVALGEYSGADGLLVGDQRQRPQRLDAEDAGVRRVDPRVWPGGVADDRLTPRED